ncbi:hypothetical protein JOS77_04455 [Chromobacterium haemolyticum]|nr:hypothetical protein JOS77_04455 [Chromobacterium haemolyticum]
MKNKRKALHPLVIGLLMAGLLAGCGSQEAASPKQGNASAAQAAVAAETPKPLKATQFKIVAAMMEELGDFSADNNTFKVISEQPLHIQLSNIAVAGVPEQQRSRRRPSAPRSTACTALSSTPRPMWSK